MAEQTITQIRRESKRLKKLAGTYTQLSRLKDELEAYKNSLSTSQQEAKEVIESIKGIQVDSQSQIEAMKQVANEINAVKETVEQTRAQAEEKRDNIASLDTKVTEQSQKVEQAEQKYTELHDKIGGLESEVKKQLAVATGGTLAHSFEQRKKQLIFSSYFWLFVLVISLLGLTLWIPSIVNQIVNGNFPNPVSYFLKVSVTFPLIGASIFAARAYTKERELEEEYAFKAAVALSLAAYQKLLKDELPEGSNEKVVEFITNSVTNIYTPPTQKSFKITKKEKDVFGSILALLKEANKLRE